MIGKYIKIAFRNIQKNRTFSLFNIVGLSAGMTAAVLIFLWVQNETTYDAWHPDADRIYRITSHTTKANILLATTPHPLAGATRAGVPEVEDITSLQPAYNTVFRINDELLAEKNSAYVDSSWFRIFHYDFVRGNPAVFFRHPYSLILTESKAKKYFGAKDPVGLIIRKDSIDFRVAAIIRDNPANSSFQLDVLMPMNALLSNPLRVRQSLQWNNYNYITFLKLRPATDPKKVAGLVTGIMHNNDPSDGKNFFSLTPLKAMHLETGITSNVIAHGSRNTVYIFGILGVFLLLIACINYVNATTARASMRAKEVGIRKIVGAGKGSLFMQFVIESLLISILSLMITLVLIRLAMPLFRQLTDVNFPEPFADPETWKILGLTLLTATLLNGIYPAHLLSSFRPLKVLRGANVLQFKDVYLRKGLVILQFTFSIILIAGTIVIQLQLGYIQHTNPGYDRSQIFYFGLPYSLFRGKTDAEQSAVTASIKAQLLSRSSIEGAAAASESIVQIGLTSSGETDWDGHDTAFTPVIYKLSADEDYNKLLHLQLQQGRWFDAQQPTDRHNFILNETAVGELNIHQPVLGQRFIFQQDTGRIIGVVKDFHFASLHEKINPLVIFNSDQWRTVFFIKTGPGKAAAALAATRSIWQRYIYDKPFEYTFLDEDFDGLYKTDAKVSTLILTFSLIAILISCLGLLGLATFNAQQRVREIGIRKILGATVANIMFLLSQDFIRLVLLSVLIATPIAWYAMHRWLQNFAYHIPLNPWIFAGAGALATLIALATIGAQSVRAATSNPVHSLRSE
jgi:ABC-type antimicrobial peptide transport system permease subunit